MHVAIYMGPDDRNNGNKKHKLINKMTILFKLNTI